MPEDTQLTQKDIDSLDLALLDPEYVPDQELMSRLESALSGRVVYGIIDRSKLGIQSSGSYINPVTGLEYDKTFGDTEISDLVTFADGLIENVVVTMTAKKGGTGKSTVSASVGAAVSNTPIPGSDKTFRVLLSDLDPAAKLHYLFPRRLKGYDAPGDEKTPEGEPVAKLCCADDIVAGKGVLDVAYDVLGFPHLKLVPGKRDSTEKQGEVFNAHDRRAFMKGVSSFQGIIINDVGAGSSAEPLEATTYWYGTNTINHTVFILDQDDPMSSKDSYSLATDSIERIILDRYRHDPDKRSRFAASLSYVKNLTGNREFRYRKNNNPQTMKKVLSHIIGKLTFDQKCSGYIADENKKRKFSEDVERFLSSARQEDDISRLSASIRENIGDAQTSDVLEKLENYIETRDKYYSFAKEIMQFIRKKINMHIIVNRADPDNYDVECADPFINTLKDDYMVGVSFLGYIPKSATITKAGRDDQFFYSDIDRDDPRRCRDRVHDYIDRIAVNLVERIVDTAKGLGKARKDLGKHPLCSANMFNSLHNLRKRMQEYIVIRQALQRCGGESYVSTIPAQA